MDLSNFLDLSIETTASVDSSSTRIGLGLLICFPNRVTEEIVDRNFKVLNILSTMSSSAIADSGALNIIILRDLESLSLISRTRSIDSGG